MESLFWTLIFSSGLSICVGIIWDGIFTNGSRLDRETADRVLRLGGLKRINFSVCGYKEDVYEKIMLGLRRKETHDNILYFLSLKKKYPRGFPEVAISTVKLDLNKDDLRGFVSFWRKQPVDFIITADLWDRVGEYRLEGVGSVGKMFIQGHWLPPCRQVFDSLYIYYDGRVAPCCDDNDKRELIVGDMNTQSLKEVLNSSSLLSLRRLHLEGKRNLHPVCSRCYHFYVI